MSSVLAANPLIQVIPGLMIWTVLCFLVTFYVLKRFAFGAIQKIIDERRQAHPRGARGGRQGARQRRARCSRSTAR